MPRYFLLLLVVAVSSAWDVDPRCLNRRGLEYFDEDEMFEEPEFEDDENFEEEEIRHLTDSELSSGLRFNMKIHWQEGYCWQDEWEERNWCMQCDGHVCGEGDKLEVQVCEKVTQQEFSWVPTDVGGRLKVADKNLCFQHINRTMYRLEVCSSSEKQVLVGFSASTPFELYPHKLVGKRCFSSQHHPKASEEVMIYRCSAARAAHANFWEVYWPSLGGNSSDSAGSSEGNSTSTYLVTPVRSCSSSNPCGECEGDCDTDSHCEGNLVCFQKDEDVPVPGCRGTDNSRTDYCVDPQNL
ncbi:hypothetical protein MHU86_8339 [Fragilaria crotonensis]|nr:hypothetical protein MHU86_8339 [Fragilaria crotonensis]